MHPLFCVPLQSAIQASLVPAVSGHVTVQVEGHVIPGPEIASNSVLRAFMEICVSWVRQKAALKHRKGQILFLTFVF